ncbi:fascin domain-containing protein [Kitasatospora sp. NPDC001119]
MPLSAADLAKLGDAPVTIQSTFFPNVFLRMDGTGVTASADHGGGTVNCQYGTGPWTAYRVRPQTDGSYSFESAAFPNVFLRMDGNGVPVTMAGGGTVNCQYGIGPWEKFNARAQADGSFSFESAAFPGIFLRMVTGSGVTSATGPGGTVNCQVKANGGENEKFYLDKAQ